MNDKEVKLLRDSFAEKCLKEVSVIDNDSGKFIVEDNGQFFVVNIVVCKEFPYELSNYFQEKRSRREMRQLKRKINKPFT